MSPFVVPLFRSGHDKEESISRTLPGSWKTRAYALIFLHSLMAWEIRLRQTAGTLSGIAYVTGWAGVICEAEGPLRVE